MALRDTALMLTVVVEVQVARPSADVAAGSWTTQAGGTTNLFATIDEATADDADYVRSSLSSASDTETRIEVEALTDPGGATGHVVRYRYKKDPADGVAVGLRVRLYDSDGTTVIASSTHADIPATWTMGTLNLSEGEAGAITGYASGLVLGLLRT